MREPRGAGQFNDLGFTLTPIIARSYCAVATAIGKGDHNGHSGNMEIQRAGKGHSRQLAQAVVPAVRSAVLLIQGHVHVVDLVADHSQRPVDWLPALQPRNRNATLPQKGMDAK